MMWLAGDDPIKIKELEKITLIDYWFQLTKKIADVKKATENKPGLNKSRGRTNNN